MIFAIKPFEIHDGDGIRTTVFFKGCPLRCRWCHNPESYEGTVQLSFDPAKCLHCLRCTGLCDAHRAVQGHHEFYREDCHGCGKCVSVCPGEALTRCGMPDETPASVAAAVLQDEIFLKESGGGVTLSGGEPLLQADFCRELITILKSHGLNIAVDTCGMVPRSAIDRVIDMTDTFLYDLKAIDEDVHIRCTGVSNRTILENLRYLDERGKDIEIRYPYIPGMNDKEAEKIGRFVAGLSHVKRLRVLGYHNMAAKKYENLGLTYPLPDTVSPTKEEIGAVIEKLRQMGVNAMTADDES